MPARIVHISTVHSPLDPRIRLRQLKSIAEHGFEAHLIVAEDGVLRTRDTVTVSRVPVRYPGRLWRVAVVAPLAVWRAYRMRAAVYHFHDPELLPWAWVLLLRRVPVVYDVHEDYSLALQQKTYLPGFVRRGSRSIANIVERALAAPFHHVIAEACYRRRFPRAVGVYNYPPRELSGAAPMVNADSTAVLYTGNLTFERGARSIARLVAYDQVISVTTVGKCARVVADEMRRIAKAASERITIVGEDRYVPFDEILEYYQSRRWIAGIVLIPDSPHYREKYLTKFFEYMAMGLPIIATDVPAWRRLIVDEGVGLCVNPDDPRAVAAAVHLLRAQPEMALTMGTRGQYLIRHRYNWERQAEQLLLLYESIMVKYIGRSE